MRWTEHIYISQDTLYIYQNNDYSNYIRFSVFSRVKKKIIHSRDTFAR